MSPLRDLLERQPRVVMGILNVTPDSFSDGGRFVDVDRAVEHAASLIAAGADIIDIGGESTRPGAAPIDAPEEINRVVPVVAAVAALGARVSIDTTKAVVAHAAIAHGAFLVNDVSGGRVDPEILDVVAAANAAYVAMHMRGQPRTMQLDPHYDNVVDDVTAFLIARVAAAIDAGIAADAIVADPGIGFGKTLEHNLALLRSVAELRADIGVPLMIGASRKAFLGLLLGELTVPAAERDDATIATTLWAFQRGASIVRVHDVARARAAADLVAALRAGTDSGRAA
jgi:dihydropteroate synthase